MNTEARRLGMNIVLDVPEAQCQIVDNLATAWHMTSDEVLTRLMAKHVDAIYLLLLRDLIQYERAMN